MFNFRRESLLIGSVSHQDYFKSMLLPLRNQVISQKACVGTQSTCVYVGGESFEFKLPFQSR